MAAPPLGVLLAVVEEFDLNACQIRDLAALRKDLGVLVNRHIRRRDALENILAGRLRALISSATG